MKHNLSNHPCENCLSCGPCEEEERWRLGFKAELRGYCDKCGMKKSARELEQEMLGRELKVPEEKHGDCPDCGIDSFIKKLIGDENSVKTG